MKYLRSAFLVLTLSLSLLEGHESIQKIENSVPSIEERYRRALWEKGQIRGRILGVAAQNPPFSYSPTEQASLWILGNDKPTIISQAKAQAMACRNINGDYLSQYKQARHPVLQQDNMHFKADLPELEWGIDYAAEEAAYYFMKLLVGEGIPPSTYCLLNNVPIFDPWTGDVELKQFSVQVSSTVKGETLCDVLHEFQPEDIKKLEYKSVSAHLLTSLILLISDGKPDNYVMDAKGKVWGIDNDIFFLRQFGISKIGNNFAFNLYFRNFLFLFPELVNQRPHADIQNYIVNTPIDAFLYWWFNALDKTTQAVDRAVLKRIISREMSDSGRLTYHFRISTVRQMAHRLKTMQILIKREATCQDIFRNIFPLLHLYYDSCLKKKHHDLYGLSLCLYKDLRGADPFIYKDPSLDIAPFLLTRKKHMVKDGRSIKEVMQDEYDASIIMHKEKYWDPIVMMDRLFYQNGSKLKPSLALRKFIKINLDPKYPPLLCRLVSGDLFAEQGEELSTMLCSFEKTLKLLDLRDNWLPSSMTQWLNPILLRHSTIRILNLCNNDLQAKGMKTLASALVTLPHLHTLNLSGNHLKNEGLEAFASAASGKLPSLKNLYLSENQLDNASGESVVKIFENFQLLKIVDLRWNQYSDAIIPLLTPFLGKSIVRLKLSHNKLSLARRYLVSYLLVRNLTTKLILSRTILTEKYFKKALLDLNIQEFIVDQIIHLSKRESQGFRFSHVNLKQADVFAFITALHHFPSIKFLSLFVVNIDEKIPGRPLLLKLIQNMKGLNQLSYLKLSKCNLSGDNIGYFLETLKFMKSLERLDLSYNAIPDKGALDISMRVTSLPSLKKVILSGNPLISNWNDHINKIIEENEQNKKYLS